MKTPTELKIITKKAEDWLRVPKAYWHGVKLQVLALNPVVPGPAAAGSKYFQKQHNKFHEKKVYVGIQLEKEQSPFNSWAWSSHSNTEKCFSYHYYSSVKSQRPYHSTRGCPELCMLHVINSLPAEFSNPKCQKSKCIHFSPSLVINIPVTPRLTVPVVYI